MPHLFRTVSTGFRCWLVLLISTQILAAQNDDDLSVPESDPFAYRQLIESSGPVAYWDFAEDSDDTSAATWRHETALRGQVRFQANGPSSAQSPRFDSKNRAVWLDGRSYLVIQDPGENSPFDFALGDTICIEAWVNPTKIGSGGNIYVIGKGRTQNKGFPRDNQNWALRLTGVGNSARLSLLFRDERNRSGESEDWHRWTSNVGFASNSGWHHVAVSYTFGKPESIAGWVDGYPTTGKWDMGKQTKLGPVVDDDEIWIGSTMGGSTGNSFVGGIDEIALYRKPLTAEEIAARCPPQPEAAPVADKDLPPGQVLVQIHEGIPDVKNWDFRIPEATESYVTDWLTFPEIPRKYSPRGILIDRSNPVLIRAHCLLHLPPGEHRVLLRSLNGARVFANGEELVRTPFHTISGTAHGHIRRVAKVQSDHIRMLQTGENEEFATLVSDGGPIRFTMEVVAGGGSKRPEFGEVSLSLETSPGEFEILGPEQTIPLNDRGWFEFLKTHRRFMAELNAERRLMAGLAERDAWEQRHRRDREWLREQLPEDYVSGDSSVIDGIINRRLESEGVAPRPPIDDWSFLRRVTLDIVGTVPDSRLIREFFADHPEGRRERYIDRLLASPDYAEHWVGYWQDVLAENPNIVNPTLNNTGPFRWWILESFQDNKPIDRFVTELIRMEGSSHYGGPGGFEMATQNDVPMAEKAHIVGTAFLGVQMKCARCHDAPFHDVGQRDLFALAAMLGRKQQGVPKSSTINLSQEAIDSLIVVVSIKPGDTVPPEWTFDELSRPEDMRQLFPEDQLDDTREQVARLITSPTNERFRNVIVNRLWKRYLGRGLVEPVDDWEFALPSHPEILEYLSRELVLSGYDLKHVIRLILNTSVYQRSAVETPPLNDSDKFHFAGPLRRRLSAEQLVDSIFVACGKDFRAGQMNIDVDGSRSFKSSLNLGRPYRAWMFTSTSNERDRPSLSLPLSQDFLNLMETLGWRAARQDPLTVREDSPSVLQAGILANGVVGRRFTRLSEDSVFTEFALKTQPVEKLIEQVFVQALTRPPRADEVELFAELLQEGYSSRVIDVPPEEIKYYYPQTSLVSWSNHLDPETSEVMIAQEAEVRRGDPPTVRLQTEWRERMEDMLWAILNTPEFIVVP
jgi:hypothetical protein